MTIGHASSCQQEHSPHNGDHHPVPPITVRERAECLPSFGTECLKALDFCFNIIGL